MPVEGRSSYDPEVDFGISSFGINYEMRLTEQNGKDDPYTFRAEFTTSLKTKEFGLSKDGQPKSIFHYSVVGTITCPEFEIEDYLALKRKYILVKHAENALRNKRPNFTIDAIEWNYTPRSLTRGEMSPSTDAFKSAAARVLGDYLRANTALLENIRTAIQSFYAGLDTQIDAIAPSDIAEFKDHFGLEKDMGTYPREQTSNILGYLFGRQLQFYNGDMIRNEGGVILVPNYWVRETEQDFSDKAKKYLGYGMKPAVVDFGFEPYPWAMVRINAVWNSVEKIIREKVSSGQHKSGYLSGQQVYIIGKRDEKMAFKPLDKQYFAGGKLADDRMEILTSLALGQLEADLQDSEQK